MNESVLIAFMHVSMNDKTFIQGESIDADNVPFQWGPGTEVIARYNFKANSEEDLTFSKGDVLTIMSATPVSVHCSSVPLPPHPSDQ